jgi:hypothetical protein
MLNPYLKFHHLGLAVRTPQHAATLVSSLGYRIGEIIFDPVQNVNLALCTHSTEPAIEIIWPGEAKGPIENLIQKHASGIVYHICYMTDNLTAAVGKLEEAGVSVTCISPPAPAVLFGGRKVSFYKILGLGLIEILE